MTSATTAPPRRDYPPAVSNAAPQRLSADRYLTIPPDAASTTGTASNNGKEDTHGLT